MLNADHYRATALQFVALARTADSPDQIREFQRLAQTFTTLADDRHRIAEDHLNTASLSREPAKRQVADANSPAA